MGAGFDGAEGLALAVERMEEPVAEANGADGPDLVAGEAQSSRSWTWLGLLGVQSDVAQCGKPQPSASVSGPCSTPGGVSLRLAAGCPAGLWPSRKPMPTGLSAAGRTAHPTRQSRGIFAGLKETKI